MLSAPYWFRQLLARAACGPRLASSPVDVQWRHLHPNRIALLKWDAIGDFVLATTFLHMAYQRWPRDRVTLFCQDHVSPLAQQQFPEWQIITVPPRKPPLKRIYAQYHLRRQWRQLTPFDLVLDLRAMRDTSDAVLASWIPARYRVALRNQYQAPSVPLRWERRVYTHLLDGPPRTWAGEALDVRNYRYLYHQFFGKPNANVALQPKLVIPEEQRQRFLQQWESETSFPSIQPFLLVCPGSLEPIKEYPTKPLAEAIAKVARERAIPVVIAGSNQDRRTTIPLLAALPGNIKTLDVTGRFSLAEHAILVSAACAVLCMDSATAHMAGALQRPAVILLGGGHPGMFAPWGASSSFRWLQNKLDCYGCHWQCRYDRALCITDISHESIAQNLLEILPR